MKWLSVGDAPEHYYFSKAGDLHLSVYHNHVDGVAWWALSCAPWFITRRLGPITAMTAAMAQRAAEDLVQYELEQALIDLKK